MLKLLIKAAISTLVVITMLFSGSSVDAQTCSGSFSCCTRKIAVFDPPGCIVGIDDPCEATFECAPDSTQSFACSPPTGFDCDIYVPTQCLGYVSGTCTYSAGNNNPTPTPSSTPMPGWQGCGSCNTCGHPGECVTDPQGACLWDATGCGPGSAGLPHSAMGVRAFCQDPGGPVYYMPNVEMFGRVITSSGNNVNYGPMSYQNTDQFGGTLFDNIDAATTCGGNGTFELGINSFPFWQTLPTGQSYSDLVGPVAGNCYTQGEWAGPNYWDSIGDPASTTAGLGPWDTCTGVTNPLTQLTRYNHAICNWQQGRYLAQFRYYNCDACSVPQITVFSPTDGQVITVNSLPATVNVTWDTVNNATAYELELYPIGTSCADPNAHCHTVALGNPLLTNSFSFDAVASRYVYRIRGVSQTCASGDSFGTWTTQIVFSLVSSVTGGVYVDNNNEAVLVGGICTNPSGNGASIDPGAGSTVTAQNASTTYPNFSVSGGTYTASSIAFNTPTSITLNPGNSAYTCVCPVGCTYGGILPPDSDINFYVSQNGGSWYQTEGGDINVSGRSALTFRDPVNSFCTPPLCSPYPLIAPLGTTNAQLGALYTFTSSLVDVSDQAGDQNLPVSPGGNDYPLRLREPPACKENYQYFYRTYSMGVNPLDDFIAPLNDPDNAHKPDVLPRNLNADGSNKGAYFHDGNLTIASDWTLSGAESIVIFVNGNLNITNQARITMPVGTFLSLIVSGDITIDPTIGDTPPVASGQVQGVYIANGSLTVQSIGAGVVDEKQFVGEGTFAVCGSVSLPRDFKNGSVANGTYNNTYPVSRFIFRPDILFNTPARMRQPKLNWHEVAP